VQFTYASLGSASAGQPEFASMASAAMISLRGRIHKHASQEDLLTLPLPLPFASRGRGGSRDSHRNNPDRPSPRAVSITLTLLVLSMLGTLAVLNNLMRAELARELAEQQQHSKMELADGKMAGRGSRETPASVVEATNPLDEVRFCTPHCFRHSRAGLLRGRLAQNLNPKRVLTPREECTARRTWRRRRRQRRRRRRGSCDATARRWRSAGELKRSRRRSWRRHVRAAEGEEEQIERLSCTAVRRAN
jgi:hypothetical protein